MAKTILTYTLVFLVIAISIGVNLSEGFLARMGVDSNMLLVALIAIAITGMVVKRNLGLIVVVVLLVLGANMPEETAAAMGINPDYLLAGLVAVVLAPFIGSHLS